MVARDWILKPNDLGGNLEQAKRSIDNLLFYAKLIHPEHWYLLDTVDGSRLVQKLGIIRKLHAEIGRTSLLQRRNILLTYPTSRNEQSEDTDIVSGFLDLVGIYSGQSRRIQDKGYVQVLSISPPISPAGYVPPQWRGNIAAAMVMWERTLMEVLREKHQIGREGWELDIAILRLSTRSNWLPSMPIPASLVSSGRLAHPGSFPNYFPWMWEFDGRKLTGPQGVLSDPGFVLPKWDIGYTEMLEAGYDHYINDPLIILMVRKMDNDLWLSQAEFWNSMKLAGQLKALMYADEVMSEGIEGWVVPKVRGDFFEGKSFDGIEYGPPGETRKSPTLMTPVPVAKRLESMFG